MLIGIRQKFLDHSQYKKKYPIFPKGWVWRAKVRIHKETEKVPPCCRGFWLLLLRVPCSPSCPDASPWKGRESPSVSCSTLVSDREHVLDHVAEILQLLGVAVPWKGKCPASFPASG